MEMNNGLVIHDYEFESYGIPPESVLINGKFDVEFTPKNRMILNIVRK
jgi:hypothetical protein